MGTFACRYHMAGKPESRSENYKQWLANKIRDETLDVMKARLAVSEFSQTCPDDIQDALVSPGEWGPRGVGKDGLGGNFLVLI
jgi:hypothetical protein